MRRSTIDCGAVYYAAADGSAISRVIAPLDSQPLARRANSTWRRPTRAAFGPFRSTSPVQSYGSTVRPGPWTFARQSRCAFWFPGGRRQRKHVRRIDSNAIRVISQDGSAARRIEMRICFQPIFVWPFGAVPHIGLWPAGVDAVARQRKPTSVRRLVVVASL